MTVARFCSLLLTAALSFPTMGCAPTPSASSAPPVTNAVPANPSTDDALVQFSLLAALAADDYAGGAPLSDVLAAGDFGIGTFDRLDGEMIVLGGQIFQALSDGTARPADLNGTTPFAVVARFESDGHLDNVSADTLDALDGQLDHELPHRNSPYALRVTGTFASVSIRSVPAQSPPFRPLVEVVKVQSTWQHENIRGTLVGIRCPQWMGTINVSGYHWHFLSDDHRIGGHVLACQFSNASLDYDECTSVLIHLPTNEEFQHFDDTAVSQQDVDRIERQRTHP
jgi:acetolactate decarboxylase